MKKPNPKMPQKVDLEPGFHNPDKANNFPGGYVNQHGILFPVGYRFIEMMSVTAKGERLKALVASIGHSKEYGVHLNVCPKCGTQMMSTESTTGTCINHKCGFSAIEYLEGIDRV